VRVATVSAGGILSVVFTGACRLDSVEMRAKYISRMVQDINDEILNVKNRKIVGNYSPQFLASYWALIAHRTGRLLPNMQKRAHILCRKLQHRGENHAVGRQGGARGHVS
jgi:hypothetical protein